MTAQIDAVLDRAVRSGAMPNVVALAADRNGLIYSGAAGPRAVGGDDPVGADTVYWIASMTKVVTTVAALQLRERGLLSFEDPVAKHCPAWDELKVLDGFDGDAPRLRPPATTATVAHLANQTAGAAYWFWSAEMNRYEQLTGQPNIITGLRRALAAPLVCDPGTRFEYGTNTDWLGLVVEAASGQSLDTYFAEHITGPLEMTDTTFQPSAEQRARRAAVHFPTPEGGWVASGMELPTEPEYWTGGHGLYSTPNDYLRFQCMLLGAGTLDGVQILTSDSVADAFRPQLGELTVPELIRTASPVNSADYPAGPGRSWGWGLILNTLAAPGMRSAGSGGWSGLANTHFWVDPAAGVTAAIYSQFLPFVAPESERAGAEFEWALYASLTKRQP